MILAGPPPLLAVPAEVASGTFTLMLNVLLSDIQMSLTVKCDQCTVGVAWLSGGENGLQP